MNVLTRVFLAAGIASCDFAADATFTTIDVPGATTTMAYDINAAGDIVGSYVSAADGRTYAFLRSRGVFTTIDFPDANFTKATGIDPSGDIVGQYRLSREPSGARHGFLLSEGEYTSIDPPASIFTNARDINSRGDIVGYFCTIVPCGGGIDEHGFLRAASGEFTAVDFPGAMGTIPWKINSRGQILGAYTNADGTGHIFLLKAGRFATIDLPDGRAVSVANGGFNPRGDLVGVYCDTAPCIITSTDDHGFLLRQGEFIPINYPGSTESGAFGINARGDIVGYYVGAGGVTHGFLLSPHY
jgi:uncharacterized membrane protein